MKAMRIRVLVLFLLALGFASVSCAQVGMMPIVNSPKASGSGSFSFVQKSADFAASTTSPVSLTLNSTGAGHLIVVQAYVRASSGGSFSVSDGVNTYTQVSAGICQNGSNTEDTFYVLSGAGGNLTISVSWSGGVIWLYGNAREYSSTTPVTYVARSCTASPTSTTAPTSDAVNANGTNNLLVGGMYDFNALSGGCGSGWGNCSSNTNQSSAGPAETEDKLNQASGNYSSTFTLGTAESDWMAEVVAFKD